jgi:hypothetical protein
MFQSSFISVSDKRVLLYLGNQECVSRKYGKIMKKCLKKDGKVTQEEEIT